jgi:hypothetical protein
MTDIDFRPGDEITIADDRDYLHGTGTLRMRLTSIDDQFQVIDGVREQWVAVHGLPLREDGSQLTDEPRWALIRVNAVEEGIR